MTVRFYNGRFQVRTCTNYVQYLRRTFHEASLYIGNADAIGSSVIPRQCQGIDFQLVQDYYIIDTHLVRTRSTTKI